jgi:hypothetical protein
MLLRREYTYADIGKRLGLTENTVRIYQALFWPVRDRGGFFVTSLVVRSKFSCGLPIVEFQQSSQPLAGADFAGGFTDSVRGPWKENYIPFPLVISFMMKM